MLSVAPRSVSRVCLGALAAIVPLLLVATAPHAANAQANLSFTGGSGTPLTLILANPITYTITTSSTDVNSAPFFVFQSPGVITPGGGTFAVTSTITYRINGGATLFIGAIGNQNATGSSNVNDLGFFGNRPGVSAGDIITLSSGTLTTTTNVAAAAPASGSFTTVINDGARLRTISTNGVAITAAPEPGSLTLLGLGFAGMMGMVVANGKRRSCHKA